MKSYLILLLVILLAGCDASKKKLTPKIRVVFDTDTNNELDDQHALAYLLFNQDVFKIEAITINTTSSGGNIEMQYAEAIRVLQLCNADTLPVLKGADQSFQQIVSTIDSAVYDGHEAVARIIEETHKRATDKLVVLAVGKLTNVAFAVAKDSTIADRIRLVWLGSNYPEPGEHNQNNDTTAMNYLLNKKIDFEMVTVRYGKTTGTSVVTITKREVGEVMPGLGPSISKSVIGRHGGEFYCFGDYAVNLFEHIDYHGDPPARSLFDMAAVAIVKNQEWAQVTAHPAPLFVNGEWIERPDNVRQIKIWENFNRDAIVQDFIESLKKY
ncbi:MAG: nucleoside hydrolase [Cytophagales bacterium]|nr:nucleoside hydrolase [Cytophagales bacterium]